tara:strand:- start:9261 stop:9944 length:684 start_codon:yes stop_codon:yes gene_type:complete
MIKKLLSTFVALFSLLLVTTNSNAGGLSIGLSGSMNMLDTGVSDDIDNNGTKDTTKSYSDDVFSGSIFAEYSIETGNGSVTVGVDYIPMDADIDKRSITQSSIKAASSTATSGTNSAEGTIENHFTFYIQPSFNIGASEIFATLGLAQADVIGKSVSLSSTDISQSKTLEGIKYGVGFKHGLTDTTFLKASVSLTDYDAVSWTTTNNTKGTADIENLDVSLSLGTSF